SYDLDACMEFRRVLFRSSDWLFDLFVEGTPKAQGSMRHVGNGRLIHGKGMVAWRTHIEHTLEQWVGTYFGMWEPLDEPVEVRAKIGRAACREGVELRGIG